MKRKVLAAVLAAATTLGSALPALADGTASTRNTALFGAAAGVLIVNYNKKLREKRKQQHDVVRRQTAYRDWYYKRYGYYPTQEQFERWYKQTYGVTPPQQL